MCIAGSYGGPDTVGEAYTYIESDNYGPIYGTINIEASQRTFGIWQFRSIINIINLTTQVNPCYRLRFLISATFRQMTCSPKDTILEENMDAVKLHARQPKHRERQAG